MFICIKLFYLVGDMFLRFSEYVFINYIFMYVRLRIDKYVFKEEVRKRERERENLIICSL